MIDQSQIRFLAPDVAVHSGVYTFTLDVEGNPAIVQARFTFMCECPQGSAMALADNMMRAFFEQN